MQTSQTDSATFDFMMNALTDWVNVYYVPLDTK